MPMDKPLEIGAAYILVTRGRNSDPPNVPVLCDTEWFFCVVEPSRRIHRVTLIDGEEDGEIPMIWIQEHLEDRMRMLFPDIDDILAVMIVLNKDHDVSVSDLLHVLSIVRVPPGDDPSWVPKRFVSDVAQKMLEVKGVGPDGRDAWFKGLLGHVRENVPVQRFSVEEVFEASDMQYER